MTTLTIEQGNNIEIVSSAVILKLYETALNSTNVTLSGNLQCAHCFEHAYDYLTGYVTLGVKRFPDLSINVTDGKYIIFADSVIDSYWANSLYGDGIGLPDTSIISITSFPERQTTQNTAIYANPKTYGAYAFYMDKTIISFNELGRFSNITKIPDSAFRGSSLKYINLDNIVTLGAGAFASADLTGVINLPKLKQFATRNTTSSVNMDDLYFGDNTNMTKIHIGANVPDEDKITSVPGYTFNGCSSLSEVTGLNMVTNISSGAFYGCSSLENLQDLNDTTAITIGGSSFYNCTSLKCIDLTNINLLERDAFSGCSNLIALDTNDLDHINDNTEYTFSIDSFGEGAFKNTGLNGKTLKFTNINNIPESLFEGSRLNKFIGTSVTTTGKNAFRNCAQLLEVLFGNVTTINQYAFLNCSNLTTIKLGNLTNDFSNITSIDTYAFAGCSSLSNISNLTNILDIRLGAFLNCGILINLLSLPNLTFIGYNAFNGCTGIQSVVDLGQITQLSSGCFENCTNLTSIIIPGTVTTADITVMNKSGVLRIIVNEGCTAIKMEGFNSYNGSIKYIEFPSTVTSMGNAFVNDTFFSNNSESKAVIIVIKAVTPPTAVKYEAAYRTCYSKIKKIYVPDDSVSAYLNSSDNIWGADYFKNLIAPVSQLQTDNPTYWAVYQSGLSNS